MTDELIKLALGRLNRLGDKIDRFIDRERAETTFAPPRDWPQTRFDSSVGA